ncbi:disulfide bond formation protein DsbA [Aliihoeflea aestuarii]|jgi:predicted DsbA family dithiol-disulfide isomerase|uniref:DsbA family oxidoreductase n=1 Tax=Aliihoeflea aestuarii TaxID=453840 RepID=UPI002093D407|nr:DsbA family oxidoreductase [Aliihoeflea aestuarii]MCO6390439.1 disulfide bond formation protein DsbA [Aliihoeflea aestuarii]
MTPHLPLSIDVVSDVVCPWCYIGLKRLDAAIAQANDVTVDVRWRPYQLDATIPAGGTDRKQYMLAKFGSEDRLAEIHARVAEAGRDAGIEFAFDAIRVSPNTLDAHRLIRWAGTEGRDVQTNLVRRLFAMYFEEGRDIGDHAVLTEAARTSGMDSAVVETLLASNADTDEVQAEIDTAAQMGVRGVPCYLVEGRYAIMGAQEPAVLADAIRQVAQARARGELGPAA